MEKYVLVLVKEMRHDIWWHTFIFNILVENRISELEIYICFSCWRGKVLISRSWEKLNSVNLLFRMSQGQMRLNKVLETELERS